MITPDARPLKIMEVCGTHTAAILKSGIAGLLPKRLKLVSGPGCPVCVTEAAYIDTLINFSRKKNHCVLCYGDLFKIRGTTSSFFEARAAGGHFEMIYSPLDAVRHSQKNADTVFALAAVGFETTAPLYALLMETLLSEGIRNIKMAVSLKAMLPALSFIAENEAVDGFICPGHVSVILGSDAYIPLCQQYHKPFVVAGFEPENILSAITEIVSQIDAGQYQVSNLYRQVVRARGNIDALALMARYFTRCDAHWRGIGLIADAGYRLREAYADYLLEMETAPPETPPQGCRCNEVLLGRITPAECSLFGKSCRIDRPVGACMASQEGACAVWHQALP